jgi:hypothetical protein
VNPEQIVAVVYGIPGKIGRFGTVAVYNLVFTDRRVVGVLPPPRAVPMMTADSGHLRDFQIREARTWRASYDAALLDGIVAGHPANFSLPYERIDTARIGGVVKKTLSMKAEGDTYVLDIPKDELEPVKAVVARRIPGAEIGGAVRAQRSGFPK